MSKNTLPPYVKKTDEKTREINGVTYSVGDYIMKRNNTPFGQGSKYAVKITSFGLKHKRIPVIIIEKNKYLLEFDGIKLYDEEEFKKITELDIAHLKSFYSENYNKDFRFACITNYTINPKFKERYATEETVLKALKEMKLKFPNKDFIYYKCSNCNHYHIGKVMTEEIIEMFDQDYLPLVGLS